MIPGIGYDMGMYHLNFDYVPTPGPEDGQASLRLTIGESLVWISADNPVEGIVRCWSDFLISLSSNWKYLLMEEAYPTKEQPQRLTELRKLLRQELSSASAEAQKYLLKTVYEFEERHDLSRYVATDARLRPFSLVREGELIVADWVENFAYLNFSDCVTTLTSLGDSIFNHLKTIDDQRCALACVEWSTRESISPILALSILTKCDLDRSAELIRLASNTEFNTVSKAAYSRDELVVLTRMVGTLAEPNVISNILTQIRRVQYRDTEALDRLSQEARAVIDANAGHPPYVQGQRLAQWFRKLPTVVDGHGVTVDLPVLRNWGVFYKRVAFQTNAIDAVAFWGPRHGPGVLLNTAGRHCSSSGGRRATIAHEICHLLVDRDRSLPVIEALGGRIPKAVEQRARAFAGELLLPQEIAVAEFRRNSNLDEALNFLTRKYFVSTALAAFQLLHADGTTLSNLEKSDLEALIQPDEYAAALPFELGESHTASIQDFNSEEFTQNLGRLFEIAVRESVAEHQRAGRSVFVQRSNTIVENSP